MEQEYVGADFFLKQVPNIKIGKEKMEDKKPPAKEELKSINLSNESQEMVMETLKYIHGPNFSLSNVSDYQDKGSSFMKRYWMERGNLIIKGVINYSNKENEPENETDRFKMFALMRLESYGFHKNHCAEALEHCEDIDKALQLLYSKYFDVHNKLEGDYSEKELMEQRTDEKGVLESIYEDAFREKLTNEVWVLSFRLNYLVNLFHPNIKKEKHAVSQESKRKKEKCRNYVRGHCKFGSKCRFLHEDQVLPINNNTHLTDYMFQLEIRFPQNSKYPYEPPLIFLKTNLTLPPLLNLHICKRLYEEAKTLSHDGMASVYSIVELLRNESEITTYIETVPVKFIAAGEKLFPRLENGDHLLVRSSHYSKGAVNKGTASVRSAETLIDEDKKIARQFRSTRTTEKYAKMSKVREKLPAWSFKEQIVEKIRQCQVVVVSGETGCGKSTQVPQFILDDWLEKLSNGAEQHVEIICTQPRRISAIGVAERVADERAEKIGQTVGYQIRLENKISTMTRLTFCTMGILLRRLELDPYLSSVSHIVVDEVHERSVESDFLLLILKNLLKVRSDFRIILMSATMNSQLFSNYFDDVPILEIPGRTFPVEQIFLEDILEITDYIMEEQSQYTRNVKSCFAELEEELKRCDVTSLNYVPKDIIRDDDLTMVQMLARYKGYSMKTCKNMFVMDPHKVNLDLIESVLLWIVSGDHEYPKTGTILIFLPGISEITSLYQQLKDHPDFSPRYGRYILIPLHSSLSSEEQALIFRKPKEGTRKIVISTNIAETSVTIDDCVFVIDSGKMKEKRFDSNRDMESLESVWTTKANASQRKGRAGRVMPGVCIHLFTSHRFQFHMSQQPVPEIHRIPLDQLLMNIKILPNFNDSSLHQVLESLIEPPVTEIIDSSIKRLQSVGAFDGAQELTPLGRHLAALPVDVKIGKLMLYGAIFACVDSALTMAACLNYKNPFVSPFDKRREADAKKKEFSDAHSDQLTVLRAYKKWRTAHSKSYFAGQNFANENYLSTKTLLMLADIKHQLLELLVAIDFIPVNLKNVRRKSGDDEVLSLTGSEFNKHGDNTRVLLAILCTALFPNIAKVLSPEKSFVASAAGAVPKMSAAKDYRFRTKHEQVFLHPSSVLFDVCNFQCSYLVYQEKIKTNKIYIRDCSTVPIISLVLFSGYDVGISVHSGTTYVTLDDGWIVFKVDDHKVAEMIKMIRLELVSLLEEKIRDPLLNILHHDKGEKIVSTILHLTTKE